MNNPDNLTRLCFPCECVSGRDEAYSDPWAKVAKLGLIGNGKKEQILNLVAEHPKTISQLAKELRIAPPSVHAHVTDLLESELLRDSEEWEKSHPKERYYEPNFPVVKVEDRSEFESICKDLSERVAEIFEKARPQFEEAFEATSLPGHGWEFTDLAQYFYACIQRGARRRLEERGILKRAEEHQNGAEWVFWAEEPSQ